MTSSLQKYLGGGRRPGAAPPLLKISDLNVTIDGNPILRNVSLDIPKGKIVALTGESGSGKSMTALASIGLLPSVATASGRITLQGQDLLSLPEHALCDLRGNAVSMIFQEPMTALNPLQTIGQQVAETALIHGTATRAEAQRIASDTLTRVGLPPGRIAHDRFPHELSGGQRQRVVIALAIALRPALLIADEPTTALDVTTQAQILDLLKQLVNEDGMALMMITHDLAVVHDLADEIAVMKDGEIVERGETKALFSAMQHPYTRALFEASRYRASLPKPRQRPALLSLQNVSRDYAGPRRLFAPRSRVRAVKDVSFDIGRGERVGLVGESGCGKSTLTRAILGLDPVSAGRITLDGAPITLEARRKIQVVFQDPYGSFNPRHRVARLITEPFHLLTDPPSGAARAEAIAQVLTSVGLSPDDQHKYIHAFSGGQRQRLAIARALIIEPELILFDEAVSALDVRVRAQVLDLIAKLSRERDLGYLFISHDLSVVRGITDRVLVMKAGEIVEQGPTEQVFGAPQHPYTQSLIQAAPVLPG